MARYRKKPVEVEAWQVGSDNPAPDWAKNHMRWHATKEGTWIVRDKPWHVFLVSEKRFECDYEVIG